MTKEYSVLQKKLQEVEFKLCSIASHETSLQPHLTDLLHKLAFLNNLLSAEMASSPSKPQHLLHISQRISMLESAVKRCEGSEPIALDDFGGSSCSCTESCFNDDGEAFYEQDAEEESASAELSGSPGKNEASAEATTVVEEDKALVEWRDGSKEEIVAEEKSRVLEAEERRRRRSLYGAMATGVVIGMAFLSLMVVLMGFLDVVQNENSVTPT